MRDVFHLRPTKVEAIAAIDKSTVARRARMRAHGIPTMPEIEERNRLRTRRTVVRAAAGLAATAAIATVTAIGAVNLLKPGRHDATAPNPSLTGIVVYQSLQPEDQRKPLDPIEGAGVLALFAITGVGAYMFSLHLDCPNTPR